MGIMGAERAVVVTTVQSLAQPRVYTVQNVRYWASGSLTYSCGPHQPPPAGPLEKVLFLMGIPAAA